MEHIGVQTGSGMCIQAACKVHRHIFPNKALLINILKDIILRVAFSKRRPIKDLVEFFPPQAPREHIVKPCCHRGSMHPIAKEGKPRARTTLQEDIETQNVE